MNKRGIERELTIKHQEFVSSIKDLEIRELVDKNSIITGGCIVSMLLNEKVNDYDYYFTDKETVLKVAQYFVREFNQNREKIHKGIMEAPEVYLDGEDQDRIRIRIKSAGVIGEETDEAQYEYFESCPDDQGDYFIANAMQRVVSDADEIDSELLEEEVRKPYRPIFLTDNAITLANKVQVVIRFYGEPKAIHESFDYVHCTNYWVSKNRKVTLKPKAIESIIAKELRYVGSKYPVCSVVRMRKFLRKGWWINAGQILKMLMQISALDLSDVDVLADQLTGVDTAYFFDLISRMKKRQAALKEEGDEAADIGMPYIVSIIDRMF